MKLRKWIYVMNPAQYGMYCDKCKGTNIQWSEYEHMIWCNDCKIDTPGFEGLFGGPIPTGVCELLGISFARVYLKDKTVRYPVVRKGKIVYAKKLPKNEIEIVLKAEK